MILCDKRVFFMYCIQFLGVVPVVQYVSIMVSAGTTPPTGIIFNFNLKNVIVGNRYLADQLIPFLLHSMFFYLLSSLQ
jgi:hypothetical protein